MKKGVRGFTIVELLVVVAVIGVLAGITVVGYARYQATTRDSQRESKATVISEALEKYYQTHGEYPGCIDLTNTTASTVVGTGGPLESVDAQTLVTPQAGSGVNNSIQCTDLTSLAGSDIFAYVGDGSPTCQSGDSCLQYTIKYKNEVDGTISSITSRHQTDIATSGGTTITATPINSTRIDVSWNEIKNANSYILERATNAGFTTGVSDIPVSGSSTTVTTSVTGLASGTRYWFKVRGVSTSGNTAWSDSTNDYTFPAAPTGVNATTTSATQVSVAWTGVTGANTYRVQRSTTADFQSGTTGSATGLASSPYSYGGLLQGTQYWFRVAATGQAGVGSYSVIDSAITTLPAPTNLATDVTSSSIDFSWDAVTNATAYDVQYSTNNFSSILGTYSNLAVTNKTISGLSIGTTYQLRVYAKNAVITSVAATTTATTTPPTPTCSATTKTSNTSITPAWNSVSGATGYKIEYSTSSTFASSVTAINSLPASPTSRTITGLNNGTTYYTRVKATAGSAESATWGVCPSVATGVDGPTSVTWSGRGEAVRCYGCVAWMPGQDPGYGSTWWTVGMYISGTCQPGATVVTRLYSYYAYSNGASANNASLMDWTWGAQDRYMVSGSDSWYGWFQGWVACQVGSTRAGDTYLGNAGPY